MLELKVHTCPIKHKPNRNRDQRCTVQVKFCDFYKKINEDLLEDLIVIRQLVIDHINRLLSRGYFGCWDML